MLVPLTFNRIFLEISCELLTEAASPLTPAETKQLPQPKPRSAKTPETKPEKPMSPVRDDLLDEEFEVPESYSDKKKFWESVTKDSISKRMSLQEVTTAEKEMVKKRTSIHEIGAAPVPKPRTILQTTQSLIEIESEENEVAKPRQTVQTSQSVVETERKEIISVKDRTVSFESSTSEISGQTQTDVTKISDSLGSPQEEKIMSEYQASFQTPSERKPSAKKDEIQEVKFDLQKADSIESDVAQKGSSQLIENAGYISDSEDVEHYISDSEIEDRVPQIRDRLMSVFVPSASTARKSVYERSASLPTEDMYEVSARNIKLRKEYYEEQIRKEMIEEQLTSEIEEEASPEKKTLLSSTEEEHTDADARSIAEDIEEDIIEEEPRTVTKLAQMFEPTKPKDIKEINVKKEKKVTSVKSIARSFEKQKSIEKIVKSTPSEESFEEKYEKEDVLHEKTSVKDLAKGYEKQLGNVIAGQRIGQSPAELKGFVLDKHVIEEYKEQREVEDQGEIVDFMEVTKPIEVTHKVEDQISVSSLPHIETHKETEVDTQPKTLESQPSVSSDKSGDLVDDQNFRDDSYSTKPDSMEVLVDKSEIEDTEKLAELDQDFEGKSIDSLDSEISPKLSQFGDEAIPEITVTLSGKQRRISEESDEYAEKEIKKSISTVTEKSDAESPIKVPEERIQDTVWEVSESHQEAAFEEKVEDFVEHKPAVKATQEFIATERTVEEPKQIAEEDKIIYVPKKHELHEDKQIVECATKTKKEHVHIPEYIHDFEADKGKLSEKFKDNVDKSKKDKLEDITKVSEEIDLSKKIISKEEIVKELKEIITEKKDTHVESKETTSIHKQIEETKREDISSEAIEKEEIHLPETCLIEREHTVTIDTVTDSAKLGDKQTSEKELTQHDKEVLKEFIKKEQILSEMYTVSKDEIESKIIHLTTAKPTTEKVDDLSADILQKFIIEEKKIAEKIAMDGDKDLEEIAREERKSEVEALPKDQFIETKDDFKEIMDQEEEISEQLEAKLKLQLTEEARSEPHEPTPDEFRSDKAEKDDDLSSSIRDESDLGSEIHQDHSDSCESDKVKSESHSDIEKIILDSLHQQRVHPEEAKRIASALIEEIEAEIQARESLVGPVDRPAPQLEYVQVSEFLKHLAETKGLDEREVELVESVLARRQRGPAKLTREDTQASSMEITDEDLKFSGTEMDYSHILEQQMDQLEAEKIEDVHLEHDHYDYEQAKRFHDKSGFVDRIDEQHREETVTSHDFVSYEGPKLTSVKKYLEIKSSDAVKGEKSVSEVKEVVFEDEETISESITEESEMLATHVDTDVKEVSQIKSEDSEVTESKLGMVEADIMQTSKMVTGKTEVRGKDLLQEKLFTKASDEDTSVISSKYQETVKSSEVRDDMQKEIEIKTEKYYDELSKKQQDISKEEMTQYKKEDGSELETKLAIDKTHTTISSAVTKIDHVHKETTSVSSTLLESAQDLDELVASGKLQIDHDGIKPEKEEVIITTHEVVKRTSSSESKSSTDAKSPEDQFSTASSGKREETDLQRTPEKDKVIFRKTKSDADTSSSSSNLKPDRKSGIDFEAYSSSGESHYHSFEMDSGKSRPCSSDVEGLVAAGSSEYESALTSQEYSSRSHVTSAEYQTAVSSLSSKESMKSLDSESSGNLASVEVSEHSETLVPSTSDLEDMVDSVDQHILGDVEPSSGWTTQGIPIRQSTEVSDSEILSYTVGESIDVSEEESSDVKVTDVQSKMKRSHEMTFQPEPKVLVPESPQGDFEERLGTSLDEGSVLSMSVSSTSSTCAQRTVIELSRADSEKLEGSMTVSGTSEHLSLDDVDAMPRGSRESLIYTPHVSTDIATSTPQLHTDLPIESVTITTSTIDENGVQSVNTQVTSETQSPVEEIAPFAIKSEEPKKKGHRRMESTSFMGPIMGITSQTRSEMERRIHSDLAESDKYTTKLSFKETSSDEKKDIDESEKEESYETEADQGFHRDLREGRYLDTESDNEPDIIDLSRPQSQFSKSDSERERSTAFSDDKLDSELAELMKSSDVTDITEPIERPISPEPCDETKDDTPEFSSEAQASVGELEQEYSSAVKRSQEIQEIRHSITTAYLPKEPLEKRDSHGKSSSTSSEKSSFEEAEAEAAFSMVAHVSPAHKIKQICPILEDEDAEKHELETRERAQKEYEERRSQQLKDVSPGFVPDIKITQHMMPLVDRDFRYPELELEEKEKQEVQVSVDTPQTPASNSSKSSEETDQGREYVLDETVTSIPEEPEGVSEEKVMTESKSEVGTVIEATVKEGSSERSTDSPSSDSFEMLEKPDLIDDFVVIEEVGKEAQEFDTEGKSVKISRIPKKTKKHDEEVEQYLVHSAPTPLTRMTDIKYYPDGTSSSEELGFDFEDSPPQVEQKSTGVTTRSTKDYGYEYDRELEANRKWIEQQFQGDQEAMMAAGYGYEMEFERGPLEDIKEEDVNDFAASSYGSQRESGGSLKDSYSSTPEYDVLAGRKYFTRSAEHDDISMSSLQEFENLEKAMSLEMRKFHQGSQDSSSNGSFKAKYCANRGGQGDDISVSSLKEFEGLEKACIAAHKIEVKVKEEEEMLAQIEEGQESIASESESCETVSGTEKKLVTDTDDDEDYEKRMFEIDEIIRQAQTNVERFVDLKDVEKTESLGRGDSIEEVAKVPDLDLDTPIVKSTIKVQWKEGDDVMITSTDSLDLQAEKPSHHDSTDSLDQKTGGDVMTASTDSIEFQVQKSTRENLTTDSIETRGEEKSSMVLSDSLELGAATSSGNVLLSDSIDEDGSRVGAYDQSSSSTGKDFSSSAKEDDMVDQEVKGDTMLESTESLDATSSTATHATYQYDTDSVYSGSFTSGGSNTMVSSTNSIDQARMGTTVDVAAVVKRVWFDEDLTGRRTTEYVEESSRPYVTEVIEPSDDDYYSHTIHRKVELPPEMRKVTFTGPDAEERMRQFIQDFKEGEDVQETEETDEAGNVHVRRVVQRRFIVKSDGTGGGEEPTSDSQIEEYFKQLNQPELIHDQGVITKSFTEGQGVMTRTITDDQGTKTTITQQFDMPSTQLTTLTRTVPGLSLLLTES